MTIRFMCLLAYWEDDRQETVMIEGTGGASRGSSGQGNWSARARDGRDA